MDEQLKSKLMGYLDGLEKSAGKVQDFAAAEIPETIREWLMWQMVEGGMIAIGGVVLFAFVLCLCRLFMRLHNNVVADRNQASFHRYSNEYWNASVAIFFVGIVASLVPVGIGMYRVAKTAVAPRVVILEKVAELTKGQK